MANTVPAEFAGIGAGALNSARQLGASLGVAVLGVILASRRAPRPAPAPLIVGGLVLLSGALIAGSSLRGRTPAQRR